MAIRILAAGQAALLFPGFAGRAFVLCIFLPYCVARTLLESCRHGNQPVRRPNTRDSGACSSGRLHRLAGRVPVRGGRSRPGAARPGAVGIRRAGRLQVAGRHERTRSYTEARAGSRRTGAREGSGPFSAGAIHAPTRVGRDRPPPGHAPDDSDPGGRDRTASSSAANFDGFQYVGVVFGAHYKK